jgi:hypothetical protein
MAKTIEHDVQHKAIGTLAYDADAFRRAAESFAAFSPGSAMLKILAMLESAVNEAEALRASAPAGIVLFPAVVCPQCARFSTVQKTG